MFVAAFRDAPVRRSAGQALPSFPSPLTGARRGVTSTATTAQQQKRQKASACTPIFARVQQVYAEQKMYKKIDVMPWPSRHGHAADTTINKGSAAAQHQICTYAPFPPHLIAHRGARHVTVRSHMYKMYQDVQKCTKMPTKTTPTGQKFVHRRYIIYFRCTTSAKMHICLLPCTPTSPTFLSPTCRPARLARQKVRVRHVVADDSLYKKMPVQKDVLLYNTYV